MSDLGYPYDNTASANMPLAAGADSSFVISANVEDNKKNHKKWLIIVLVLFLLLSFVVSLIIVQQRQSVADIRNYASYENEEAGSQGGFGGLVTTPAQILVNQNPPCIGCQTAQTTITAIRVTPTPTPSPTTKPIAVNKTPTPTSKPNLPTATPIQQQSTAPTATPVPVLSCQRVELFLGTDNVTGDLSRIKYGDTVRFVGYVSDVGRAVASITFRLMINDQTIEEKEAPAALSGNAWVAQYEHAFTVYGRHRVTVTSITPK